VSELNKDLPQQTFTVHSVVLVSGTTYTFTIVPLFTSKFSRIAINDIADLVGVGGLHSTRVTVKQIVSDGVITVESTPSALEDPEGDSGAVDLTLYINGTLYVHRQTCDPWRWGWYY
jgi:hypothetical protein